jgi:hypothetical protein
MTGNVSDDVIARSSHPECNVHRRTRAHRCSGNAIKFGANVIIAIFGYFYHFSANFFLQIFTIFRRFISEIISEKTVIFSKVNVVINFCHKIAIL